MEVPHLIDFQHIGEPKIGYISVAEPSKNIPFEIKRVYWVYNTPEEIERGNHANHKAQHVLVCVKGKVSIILENVSGTSYHFVLNDPNVGLYVPALYWRKLSMTYDAVCLSLCSTLYEEEDYIRDYQEFLKLKVK